jgi:hypothetical protein
VALGLLFYVVVWVAICPGMLLPPAQMYTAFFIHFWRPRKRAISDLSELPASADWLQAGAMSEFAFEAGEKVLAFHGPQIYEGKVRDVHMERHQIQPEKLGACALIAGALNTLIAGAFMQQLVPLKVGVEGTRHSLQPTLQMHLALCSISCTLSSDPFSRKAE